MSVLEPPSAPQEAATVILIRGKKKGRFEVFLARRHRNQSFMAEAYVFPGGQVAFSDADQQLNNHILAPDPFRWRDGIQDESSSAVMAQRFFICAIRETFEEAGVLLVRTAGSHPLQFDSEEKQARFTRHRSELNAGRITLKNIAQEEDLLFALNTLVPYAHWITPEISPRRFSTLFFLAELPEGQSATTDCSELTASLWATPRDLLQMQSRRELILMPPTLKTLEELASFPNIDALFRAARRRIIYPILPEVSENILKLPHDPEYSIDRYKRPARLDEPSRIIHTDGVWRTGYFPSR